MDEESVVFRRMLKLHVHPEAHDVFETWLARVEVLLEGEQRRASVMRSALNALLAGPGQQLSWIRARGSKWGAGKSKADQIQEEDLRVLDTRPAKHQLKVMCIRELLAQELARRALEIVAKSNRQEEEALNARATARETGRDAV